MSGPRLVGLVVLVCGNLGRHFCSRGLCRSRPVMTLLARMCRWACSVAAVRVAGGVVAVTWLWFMDRMASRRTVVNEISSVVTLPARAAVWAARRTSWVAASQAQISCRTRSGSRSAGSGRGTGRRR